MELTPLNVACLKGNEEVVAGLLAAMDKHLRLQDQSESGGGSGGHNSHQTAAARVRVEAATCAAAKGQSKLLRFFYSESGSAQEYGATDDPALFIAGQGPAWWAAHRGDVQCLKALKACGVDLGAACNAQGETPADVAAAAKQPHCVKFLASEAAAGSDGEEGKRVGTI